VVSKFVRTGLPSYSVGVRLDRRVYKSEVWPDVLSKFVRTGLPSYSVGVRLERPSTL